LGGCATQEVKLSCEQLLAAQLSTMLLPAHLNALAHQTMSWVCAWPHRPHGRPPVHCCRETAPQNFVFLQSLTEPEHQPRGRRWWAHKGRRNHRVTDWFGLEGTL